MMDFIGTLMLAWVAGFCWLTLFDGVAKRVVDVPCNIVGGGVVGLITTITLFVLF